MSLTTLIGRGGLAGACAGLVSGLFSLVLAEPVMDRAIALEHQRSAASGEEHGAELFTRDVQHIGLLVATVMTGLAIGLIFGVIYAVLHRRDPAADPWARSLRLAAGGFVGVSLLPFLRFPANPPGVGDPDTVDVRTIAWLAAIVIGLAAIVGAAEVSRLLARRSVPARQLAAVGVVVIGLAALFLLPGSVEVTGVPADLLWTFRLFSIAGTALLWGGLGVAFGLAGLRAGRVLEASAA